MIDKVTIEFPGDLAQQVRTIAARTQRTFDEVVLDCVRRASVEPALELLSDVELLAAADAQMPAGEDDELSGLLERNQDATLSAAERVRFDELMQQYRRGLVRKAKAIELAVRRGLRPRLG